MSSVAMMLNVLGMKLQNFCIRLMLGKTADKEAVINGYANACIPEESTANFFHDNPLVVDVKRYMLTHYQ